MDSFTFYSPTFFAFGKGTESDAGKYVKRFGGHKVLIHYGGGSAVKSGLIDRVIQGNRCRNTVRRRLLGFLYRNTN